MRYFTIGEFTKSATADRLRINNSPSEEIKFHITEFIETVLDPLRESWGAPIYVTSGFRCWKLNNAVGGARYSGHLYGWTADLQVKGDIKKFADFVQRWMLERGLKWDELIFERSGGTTWLHFAWKGYNGRQRMKCFPMVVK